VNDTATSPAQVTVVHAPACHYCDDAIQVLTELAGTHLIDLKVVELDSTEGALLAARHRPAMNPLVLIDGRFFSSGRLPRKKLLRLLAARDSDASPRDVLRGA
jgi:glutaredoxin